MGLLVGPSHLLLWYCIASIAVDPSTAYLVSNEFCLFFPQVASATAVSLATPIRKPQDEPRLVPTASA